MDRCLTSAEVLRYLGGQQMPDEIRQTDAHLSGSDGDDEQGSGHKKSLFNRLAEEARWLRGIVDLRPRQSPLQSGRNTTNQIQTTACPSRRQSGAGRVWWRP